MKLIERWKQGRVVKSWITYCSHSFSVRFPLFMLRTERRWETRENHTGWYVPCLWVNFRRPDYCVWNLNFGFYFHFHSKYEFLEEFTPRHEEYYGVPYECKNT